MVQRTRQKRQFKELCVHWDFGEPRQDGNELVYPASIIICQDDGKLVNPVRGKDIIDIKINGQSMRSAIVPSGSLITNSEGEIPFDLRIEDKPQTLNLLVGFTWSRSTKWVAAQLVVKGGPQSESTSVTKVVINESNKDKVYLNEVEDDGFFNAHLDIGESESIAEFSSKFGFELTLVNLYSRLSAESHEARVEKSQLFRIRPAKDFQKIQLKVSDIVKTLICIK